MYCRSITARNLVTSIYRKAPEHEHSENDESGVSMRARSKQFRVKSRASKRANSRGAIGEIHIEKRSGRQGTARQRGRDCENEQCQLTPPGRNRDDTVNIFFLFGHGQVYLVGQGCGELGASSSGRVVSKLAPHPCEC
jgi:hypothetical protein